MVPVSQSYFNLNDIVQHSDDIDSDKELTFDQLVFAYRLRLLEYTEDLNRKYHFHYPEEFGSYVMPKTTGVESEKVVYRVKNNIVETISEWVKMIPQVRAGLKSCYPREIYDISFDIDMSEAKFNTDLNDYENIRVHVRVNKMFDHRFAPLNNDEIRACSPVHREAIIKNRSLRRVYSYMYTKDNTEVESMDLKLNVYYYTKLERENTSFYESRLNKAANNTSPQFDLPNRLRLGKHTLDQKTHDHIMSLLNLTTLNPDLNADGGLTGVRGTIVSGDIIGSKASAAGTTVTTDTPERIAADAETRAYGAEWNRMVNVDLVTLEAFTVRGDPNWLFSYNNSYEPFELNNPAHKSLYVTPTIYIRVYRPSQAEYMSEDNLREPMELDGDLSGFYQVVTCEHSFSNGKFTNKLQGYRLPIS